MRIFRFFAAWRQDIKIGGQPEVVYEDEKPDFVYSSKVSQALQRRTEERRKKFNKLNNDANVAMASQIIKEAQQPMEFKLQKGYRDALAGQIVYELAKKVR